MPHLSNVQPVSLVIADPPPDCEGVSLTAAARLLLLAYDVPSLTNREVAVREYRDGQYFMIFVDHVMLVCCYGEDATRRWLEYRIEIEKESEGLK